MKNKNFIMIVIGQIISLFGNAILRFALPLYLLNETDSPGLFGIVSACAFIPMIIMGPIGGIIADRVNKRNIMVILDFFTAALVLSVIILLGKVNLVALLFVAMFTLYGIQGAYQPAVQASVPILLTGAQIMKGNAVINLVSSFSGLVGPTLGGVLFGFFGIMSILYVSTVCFVISAVMEIFIKIPFTKRKIEGSIIKTGCNDLKESFYYMHRKQPLILKFSFLIAAFNMILSSLLTIGLPVLVTQMLEFDEETANHLYGYAQGIVAFGSLCGGLLAGMLASKFKARNGYLLLLYNGVFLIPIGFALIFDMPKMVCYFTIMICCFIMMLLATIFSVQIMSYLQMIVPNDLLGKIISCAMCIAMCASPLGQAIYGVLFDAVSRNNVHYLFYVVAIIVILLGAAMRKSFRALEKVIDSKEIYSFDNAEE